MHSGVEGIHISLKEKSLESITDSQFNSLRKAYLNNVNKFYRKNLRKCDFGGSKTLEYVGAAFMAAGAYGATQTEHWWLALLMGSPGLIMIGRSVLNRRRMRKDIMSLLEKETAEMPYEELEQKLANQDYEPTTRNEEQVQMDEMDVFAYDVTHRVLSREHMLTNRLPSMAGIGVLLGGFYISQNGSPYLGGVIAFAGAVMASAFEYRGFRKMRKLVKDVKRVIHEKGYEFFKLHANKARPYDFYTRHILPEIEGKPVDSE